MFASTAIQAIGGLFGANQQSNATEHAADQQAAGTAAGIAENRRQYDQTRTDNLPFLNAGKVALGQFATENNKPLDLTKIQMDPGYEFARQQGQQGIDRKNAAAGGRISGQALKEASQYNNNFATQGYSAAYGRANQSRTDRLNRLAALADIGQTSTNNVSSAGANAANNNSALLVNQGSNAGAATLAQGNIWGNTANQLAALYGRGGFNSGGGASNVSPNVNYGNWGEN